MKKTVQAQFYSPSLKAWVDLTAQPSPSLRLAGMVINDYHAKHPASGPLRLVVHETECTEVPVMFIKCASDQCNQEFFCSSQHKRQFCSYRCASLASMRRTRAKAKGVQ